MLFILNDHFAPVNTVLQCWSDNWYWWQARFSEFSRMLDETCVQGTHGSISVLLTFL